MNTRSGTVEEELNSKLFAVCDVLLSVSLSKGGAQLLGDELLLPAISCSSSRISMASVKKENILMLYILQILHNLTA